jgi:hypothetical protein
LEAQLAMEEAEMVQRVKNLVAVLGRMSGKISAWDLDALQECLRLAESVPGLREGLVQVRLAEGALGEALRRYGRHRPGCTASACRCGLRAALEVGAGPDLLVYLLLLRALAAGVRRCQQPIPEELWEAAGKVARWEAAHRSVLRLLGEAGG